MDPNACDHPLGARELTGPAQPAGTFYGAVYEFMVFDGTCRQCGASAATVYRLQPYRSTDVPGMGADPPPLADPDGGDGE